MKPFLLAALAASLVFVPAAQASHSSWGVLGFDSYNATTDVNATCGEASIHTAGAINAIYAGNPVNGGVKANCPGPHPSVSSKWQQWVNAAGNRIFDCLYDEDPGLIEVSCRDFQNWNPYTHSGGGWLYQEGIITTGVNGTAVCSEANFWVAALISEIWGQAAVNGAFVGNCAGAFINNSAKYSQWGGPNGNVMYSCLYDEDLPNKINLSCFGPASGRYNLAR